MVFRKRKHRVRGVKRKGKRGGFIISIPLLIAGAITAAKLAAGGAAMAGGEGWLWTRQSKRSREAKEAKIV